MIQHHAADEVQADLSPGDAAAGFHAARRQAAELRSALMILTRLPVIGGPKVGTGARAFGFVGAMIGLAGFVPLMVLGVAVPPGSAILAISAMAVLSGAIHLDGLADTADALVAVGPDAAERARNDPAIGVGGAAALILVLGLEITALTLLVTGPGPLYAGINCIVAGAASRIVPVVLARIARSRAISMGMGAWFAGLMSTADAVMALTTGVVVTIGGALLLGTPVPLAAGLVGVIGGLGLGFGLVRARRQLDGDVLGASVELAFTSTVLAAATLAGWPSA